MQKIYLIGDIHGSFKPIRNFYQRHIQLHRDINNCIDNVLICLGDFGGNFFFNHRDIEFKKKLGTYNLTYFVIRGNHEERPSICAAKNPDKWHTEEFWGNTVYVENKFPYIKYALDEVAFYYIPYVKIPYYLRDDNKETGDIEWEDLMDVYKTLVIPGAYSVDKYKRLEEGWSWFPQEQLSESERLAGLALIEKHSWNCDLVLSHTCPICYEPTDLFLSFVNQSMVEKDMECYLGQIEYTLDYKAWFWGHYHAFRDYPRTDGKIKLMLSAGAEVVELNQVLNNSEVEKL